MRRTFWLGMTIGTALATFALGGCGDDADTAGSGGGTTSQGGEGGLGAGGQAAGGQATGGQGEGGEGEGGSGGATLEFEDFAVLIIGELFTEDMVEAQAAHDAVAAAGEEQAKAAGDFGHDALLGTTHLGTTENQFLGIDRWDDASAMTAFYSDPNFAAAFGALFTAPPPVPEAFGRPAGWHTWGSMTAGDTFDPYFFVVVRGRLASADITAMNELHDQIAAGGEEAATGLGDVAHNVFLGLEDPREFLAVDVWNADTNIEALYENPDFAAAFAQLFEGTPTLRVYESTDWHQW